MSLYKLISQQFGELHPEIDFKQLDILEYMVLEKGGCLSALKDMPLKTVNISGYTSIYRFNDSNRRSSIQIGFHNQVDNITKRHLSEALRKMPSRFSEYTYDSENLYYNIHDTEFAFILLDQDIEDAIKSSSLFIAAGDLSELSLTKLLELRENISLYKISDSNLSRIVDMLTAKITLHIEIVFNKSSIRKAYLSVSNKFNAQQTIVTQEQKFNDLFFELENHLVHLEKKGTPLREGKSWRLGVGPSYVPNPDYVSGYENIASAALKLRTTLKKARDEFFSNPPTETSLKQFQDTCNLAIKDAKTAFINEPSGIWDLLLPILKGILGFVAAITVIPAIVIEIKSSRGFIGTFFESPKNDSVLKLESFENNVCGEGGVFDELESATNLIKMN